MGSHISSLLELEKRLRRAESPAQLGYILVNQSDRCLPCVQSVLLRRSSLGQLRAEAASDIVMIDYTCPFIQWVESLGSSLVATQTNPEICAIHRTAAPDEFIQDWCEMAPDHLLLIPLINTIENREPPGWLLLFRDQPWTDSEKIIAEHLSESMGHALLALHRPHVAIRLLARLRKRKAVGLIALVLLASLCLPVRLSTLAPVEVIAKDPYVISAPMNGVIKEVKVDPNASIEPGHLLVELIDTQLQSEFEVAEQTLNLARAALKTTEQSGFMDPSVKAQMAELKARVKLRAAERDFAAEKLAKTLLRAPASGVVVLEDPDMWKGRPVSVGERIMLLASPDQIELEILLPVKDSIALQAAEVRLFFDHEPLNVWKGRVKHASYTPTLTPEDQMAYRLIAELNTETTTETTTGTTTGTTSETLPRIGMRGTAKLYGEQVSLFFLLFRRPITSVRQWLGW